MTNVSRLACSSECSWFFHLAIFRMECQFLMFCWQFIFRQFILTIIIFIIMKSVNPPLDVAALGSQHSGSSPPTSPYPRKGLAFASSVKPFHSPHPITLPLDYIPFKPWTCRILGYFSWIHAWHCCHQKPFSAQNYFAANIIQRLVSAQTKCGSWQYPRPYSWIKGILLRGGEDREGKGTGYELREGREE